jgi:hypothetical protein
VGCLDDDVALSKRVNEEEALLVVGGQVVGVDEVAAGVGVVIALDLVACGLGLALDPTPIARVAVPPGGIDRVE